MFLDGSAMWRGVDGEVSAGQRRAGGLGLAHPTLVEAKPMSSVSGGVGANAMIAVRDDSSAHFGRAPRA